MLEDRALGNAQARGNVSHPRGVVALLGKMAHGRIDDPGSLAFGTGPRSHVPITRRRNQAAADPTHRLTSGHGTVINGSVKFNCILHDAGSSKFAGATIMTSSRIPGVVPKRSKRAG